MIPASTLPPLAVDTYFDASLGSGDVDRALTINQTTAIDTANAEFPEWDAMLVLVNTTQYAARGRDRRRWSRLAGPDLR